MITEHMKFQKVFIVTKQQYIKLNTAHKFVNLNKFYSKIIILIAEKNCFYNFDTHCLLFSNQILISNRKNDVPNVFFLII